MPGASPPLSESLLSVVARMVDDHAGPTREPSHSVLADLINRAGISEGDPGRSPRPVGKEKRVRGVLSWALANSVPEGGRFVSLLLAELRACGGFREESPNFVGSAIVDDAISVFAAEGFVLGRDGTLSPRLLSSLGGRDTSEALRGYINRIRAGYDDSALVVGTGKE